MLTATTADLQSLLEDGHVFRVDLLEVYLEQIKKHNHREMKLYTVIETGPKSDLLGRARETEQERKWSGPQGPLHGVFVLVEVRDSYLSLISF